MYYYHDGENEVGPFSISKLRELLASGLIAGGTLVRRSDSRNWLKCAEMISQEDETSAQHWDQKVSREPEYETVVAPDLSAADPSVGDGSSLEAIKEERSSHRDRTIFEAEATVQPGDKEENQADSGVWSEDDEVSRKNQDFTDPAYKYMPRSKPTESEEKHDPAYKYMPQSKPKPSEAKDDPAFKYMPKRKSEPRGQNNQHSDAVNTPPGWLSSPVTPWRRYAARTLDTLVNGIIGTIAFAFIFYAIAPATADDFFFSTLESDGGFLIDVLITGAIASVISGALIGITGFTLGKLIFGIKVVRANGHRVGVRAGLARDFEVWVKGMGLGIPLISLITLIAAYRNLMRSHTTSWDDGEFLVLHRPAGSAQFLLNVLGLVAIVLGVAAFSVLSRI